MSEIIRNAIIKNVTLGYEDHGILTFDLNLDISDGTSCMWGGYELDEYDKTLKERVCRSYGLKLLTEVMKTVGVDRWEDLKGKYIRIEDRGLGRPIKKIGNIMEDKWFDIEEFYKKEGL